MISIVQLADVNGSPKIKAELPAPLRIGDPVAMRFIIERENGGRLEQLKVNGRFRVSALGFEGRQGLMRQLVSVDSIDATPTWVSIRKRAHEPRRLGPTRFPRTAV